MIGVIAWCGLLVALLPVVPPTYLSHAAHRPWEILLLGLFAAAVMRFASP